MSINEAVESAQIVIGKDGKPSAVIIDIDVWETVLSALEDLEDMSLVRKRLRNWRAKTGWTSWDDIEAESESDDLSFVD